MQWCITTAIIVCRAVSRLASHCHAPGAVKAGIGPYPIRQPASPTITTQLKRPHDVSDIHKQSSTVQLPASEVVFDVPAGQSWHSARETVRITILPPSTTMALLPSGVTPIPVSFQVPENIELVPIPSAMPAVPYAICQSW